VEDGCRARDAFALLYTGTLCVVYLKEVLSVVKEIVESGVGEGQPAICAKSAPPQTSKASIL